MAHDREVAGIRCTEVLAHLSDYVDGEVSPELRAQIDAHLAGCSWCEEFGGEFSETVARVRRTLNVTRAPDRVSERLARRLAAERRSS